MDSFSKALILSDDLGINSNNGYRLIFGNEVTRTDISSALAIDYMSYDDLFHLDLQLCVNYHLKNPYIYIMAVDGSRNVVGYINFSPVNELIYESMRSGSAIDTIISSNDILLYEKGKNYSIYFSSICVHPAHRHLGVAKLLLKGLDELINRLEAEDVRIVRIVADAVSEAGEKLLVGLGYNFICTSEHGSKIMEKEQHV